jgi:hypothetical protein
LVNQRLNDSQDIDFRFLEVPDVMATMERAGFLVQARLERVNHPGEVETRRGYLLARLAPP